MIKSFGKLVVPQKELEPQLNFLRINAVWNKNSFTLFWQARRMQTSVLFFAQKKLFEIYFTVSSMVLAKINMASPNHGFV